MQATLPKSLIEPTLLDMGGGQSTWTLPWAMYADDDGKLWLNGDYPQSTRGGTAQMKVRKTMSGDYVCDITHCRNKSYSLGGGKGFFTEFTPIPVAKLITNNKLREIFGILTE